MTIPLLQNLQLTWPGQARAGQARPERNFCLEVNWRFCTSGMVTLYMADKYLHIFRLLIFMRMVIQSPPVTMLPRQKMSRDKHLENQSDGKTTKISNSQSIVQYRRRNEFDRCAAYPERIANTHIKQDAFSLLFAILQIDAARCRRKRSITIKFDPRAR